MSNYLTVSDISWEVDDIDPAKQLEKEKFFAEADIERAMKRTVMAVRALPPVMIGSNLTWDTLPATEPFLDLTVSILYDRVVAKIDREEIDIKGGSVDISYLTKIRDNLKRRAQELRMRGESGVRSWKLTINLNSGWGTH